jgi:hypothetical protein
MLIKKIKREKKKKWKAIPARRGEEKTRSWGEKKKKERDVGVFYIRRRRRKEEEAACWLWNEGF